MKKIYLSGQIDGLTAEECIRNFEEAAEIAKEVYGEDSVIINPYLLPRIHKTWADYIIRDLVILKDCDVIVMLSNWVNSSGAKVERIFAEKMGLSVFEI